VHVVCRAHLVAVPDDAVPSKPVGAVHVPVELHRHSNTQATLDEADQGELQPTQRSPNRRRMSLHPASERISGYDEAMAQSHADNGGAEKQQSKDLFEW
jgi:hypothetical protein